MSVDTLYIMNIIEDTTVDGPGFRTSVYSSGCTHACKGCHNPSSWDINHGKAMHIDDILKTVLSNPFADVTFSGGDPMMQAEGFAELASRIKTKSHKNIWCYTGYHFEELLKMEAPLKLLQHIDVLVDGPFILEQRDTSLLFKGSGNQRLIDVPLSLKYDKTILFQLPDYSFL